MTDERSSTPPDFESVPDIAIRLEMRRISKLVEYMERDNSEAHLRVFTALGELSADRKWFKWFASVLGGVLATAIVVVLYGASKLNSIEGAVDTYVGESSEIMRGLRRDLDKVSTGLDRLQDRSERLDRIEPR